MTDHKPAATFVTAGSSETDSRYVMMSTQSLVLLGDSILDNAPYTRPDPDTTTHLQRSLPDWTVVRLARDGAVMSDIRHQLRELTNPAAAAVLSVGGNDVIQHIGVLDRPGSSSRDILGELLGIAERFESEYEGVARSVAGHAERTILCTIYEVQLEPAPFAQLVRVPLALLNDRIVRVATRLGLDVLELRSVCTEASDYVLQIEPSARGAAKIAAAIAQMLNGDSTLGSSRVFALHGESRSRASA